VRAGGWWHEVPEDGGRLTCDLCPRGCTLRPGDRGFCFVRQNRDGRVVSTTYGRSTGFCIDPIEKKPLHQFYPGTSVLSFGTAGCNLGCEFCQNWTMSKSRDVEAACEQAAPQAIAEAAHRLGCRSVAFTYNDPIIWAEYAIDTARACRELGIKTVAVTSGYIMPTPRAAFYQVMDAANVDLKAFSEDFYVKMTGGHLQPVLDTLRWLAHESDTWLEITNLVIPQANDSPEELKRMCQWILDELGPDVPLHFSAFHPDFKLTDRGPTPLETLLQAHDIARQAGLHYVYTGNVRAQEHQATYCPGCGRMVIERDGYELGAYHIQEGRCGFCRTPIAGRFDPAPGNWGAGRQPVRMASFALAAPAAPAAHKESTVESTPADQPELTPSSDTRPALSPEQEQLVFRVAGHRVAAAVRSQPPESTEAALGDAADVPLYGAFVSLKRGGQLRSCCGFLAPSIPLAEALEHAAVRAAKEDPRFPPISPSELEHLDMEVWLLWGLRPVVARGEDRAAAVTIGKHGLQIAQGSARGLLLPGVAVEHNLDARGFLRQVCLKAGLPPEAWKSDDAVLMTFEGFAIRGRLQPPPGGQPARQSGPTQADLAALRDFCRENLVALLRGATPSYYLPGGFDGDVNGLALSIGPPGSQQRIECSKFSLPAAMPLQASLFTLAEAAAKALRSRQIDAAALRAAPIGLSVLFDPALHGTAAQAELQGVDPRRRAVLVTAGGPAAWGYDPRQTAETLLEQALRLAGLTDPTGAQVISLAVASTEPSVAMVQAPRPQPGLDVRPAAQVPHPELGPDVRPPAVAGAFYPGWPEQLERMLDEMFPGEPRGESWAGVMVPHAGWSYSGALAAKVFSRVKIPPQVIILSPKHRPGGADWAVAPHQRWLLPGREVASDPVLAAQLAAAVTGLELDAVPHRQEHAIEVQLPLLARLAPQVRVVGITIGGGELDSLCRFAQQLAGLLRDLPERPLLVVSSDMNHFADDAQTRRLDRLALDAMESLDPRRLYETVRRHQISMCGMLPAVIVMETLRQLDGLHRCESVGYATSADSTGDTQRVVGYAGMLLG
jgi:AmmeMemoRadiSam system radical SAM enzyme/AmmeMemoRadiSam system protein B/AmmeMemoRadiSam system protein A